MSNETSSVSLDFFSFVSLLQKPVPHVLYFSFLCVQGPISLLHQSLMRPLNPPRLLPLLPIRHTHPPTPCTAPTFLLRRLPPPPPPTTSSKSCRLKFSASSTVAQAPQCLRASQEYPSLKAMGPHRAPASPPPLCPTRPCLPMTLRT